ncbi:[citrate (pro-3S)-lyase] ligase [Bombilactobacillus thymidiniphilus]|uniref:[Citrate [pro-3S]-lyase] ligase n=1 Tax=Bombilactobacillus thymidiniphilus TaxID=2923363 RepID=A0ABY4PBV3_9LACO|nr:[citrate (pro-3S)-lyase] ligase [Bombilactobacillus thymidiniphilus]UQS83162.1 [citrate (pro-3S)-lyase] ligase [Bombilactobacillus thymidiniphilus]
MEVIKDLYLLNSAVKKQWESFLQQHGIDNFNNAETKYLNQTVGLFDEHDQLVGTGSIAQNVMKYVAIEVHGEIHAGVRFNKIISALIQRLDQAQISHYFVFTKIKYVSSFKHIGFHCLAQVPQGALLESGFPTIKNYLAQLSQPNSEQQQVAAIVINANPFTKGHRYLIEKAAQENDLVYVIVVQQNASLFTTPQRLYLVRLGVQDLMNVKVIDGGEYTVSFATFPAYFLTSSDAVIDYQTRLDAQLFKNWFVPALQIKRRYLGTEPTSHTTRLYNDNLQAILQPEVEVLVVPRYQLADGQIVSAFQVRHYLVTQNLEQIARLVPATTFDFIKAHWAILQQRIQKGWHGNGN